MSRNKMRNAPLDSNRKVLGMSKKKGKKGISRAKKKLSGRDAQLKKQMEDMGL